MLLTGAAIFLTLRQTKIYEARSRLFVGQTTTGPQDIQFAQSLAQTSLALVKSYSEAIKTVPIAQDVLMKLGLKGDPEQLVGQVAAEPVAETQIIGLSYRDADPEQARNVANAFATSFISALDRIDPKGAVRVTVLEPATVPRVPVSPQPKRSAAVGLFLGLVVAGGAVLLAEQLDSTVKGRDDVEEAAGAPVLALVPHVASAKGEMIDVLGTAAGESFHSLRSAIQYTALDSGAKIIAVTSAEAGDGKTTTAFHLTSSFAQAGLQAIYLECDLRRPNIARKLRIPDKDGLASYLSSDGPEDKPLGVVNVQPNLHIVPAGDIPKNPMQLMEGPKFRELLDSLRDQADVIVLDTPPVLAVSDPLALVSVVDSVLIIVRSNKTRHEHLTETMRVLRGVGAKVMGVVVNDISKARRGYGYYGYYGYKSSEPAPE